MENVLNVSVRLQRVTTESATVLVPITPAVMCPDPSDERRWTLDVEKALQAAVQIGRDPSTRWLPEGLPLIQPHPEQTPAAGE